MPTAAKKRQPTVPISYKLPPDLIRRVRIEAARRGVWPARVVAERLAASFREQSGEATHGE